MIACDKYVDFLDVINEQSIGAEIGAESLLGSVTTRCQHGITPLSTRCVLSGVKWEFLWRINVLTSFDVVCWPQCWLSVCQA